MSKKYLDFARYEKECDFSGWATKNNILCTDGATIMHGAFTDCHGKKVPIVFNHDHSDIESVLGHGFLEEREAGTYMYGFFNDSPRGRAGKEAVQHGDITSLSIWANQLKRQGRAVVHGDIKEVSLVLAGANMGALIENVNLSHAETGEEDEAIIWVSDEDNAIVHSEYSEDEDAHDEEIQEEIEDVDDDEIEHADEDSEESVSDVLATLTEKQRIAVATVVDALLEEEDGSDDDDDEDEDEVHHSGLEEENEDSEGGNDVMKHNAFEDEENMQNDFLSHSEIEDIFRDAKGALGSLRKACEQHQAVIAHAVENANGTVQTYGIADIDTLFPEARLINNPPAFIARKMEWVSRVMSGVKKSPFSRIKSQFANITMDEARALGYIKGNEKKTEVFSLLRRSTTPQTIYKKQQLDRDDIIDITDFNVVAWLKQEMRMMLDEEIARAILIGDGRAVESLDKISEEHIRPVWKDAELFTVKVTVPVTAASTTDDVAKATIRAIIKARKEYRGTGNPVYFTTEDALTDMLLLTDGMGRDLYDSVAKLCTKLRVSDIITVPVMEGQSRTVDGKVRNLQGLIVNLSDYTVGTDKGGEVNMFDDFDIDFNQEKYLIETRMSGALTVPYSALAVETVVETPEVAG